MFLKRFSIQGEEIMTLKKLAYKIIMTALICSIHLSDSFSQEIQLELLGGYTTNNKAASIITRVYGIILEWSEVLTEKTILSSPIEGVPELPDIESELFDTALVIAFKGHNKVNIISCEYIENDEKIKISFELNDSIYMIPDWYDPTGEAMTRAFLNMYYKLYSPDIDVTEKSVEFVDLSTSVKPQQNFKTQALVRPKLISKNKYSDFNLLGKITGIKKCNGYTIRANNYDIKNQIILK